MIIYSSEQGHIRTRHNQPLDHAAMKAAFTTIDTAIEEGSDKEDDRSI
jgi:hypothetical protein